MKVSVIVGALLAMTVTSGCAGKQKVIEAMSRDLSQDKFQEIAKDASPATGYADIEVVSSIKTRKQGAFLVETTAHGTPDYLLWLAVDGQVLRLKGDLRPDKGGYAGETDPEAGDGIRYRFSTRLRLTSGTHKVAAGLPEDGVVVEKEMQIREGLNRLVITPLYRKTDRKRMIGFGGETSFYGGVKGLLMSLNDKVL